MRALLVVVLLTVVGIAGCTEPEATSAPAADVEPVAFNSEGRPVVEFDVPGLHCEHCSATACELLADVPGVVDVEADSEQKKAKVAVDQSQFDANAAREVLEEQFGEATIAQEQAAVDIEAAAEKS